MSDTPFRQSSAVSETADPNSGTQNGACRTTALDCGIYQEVMVPASGNYGLFFHAHADHPGGLVGANLNGSTAFSVPVQVGGYQIYSGLIVATVSDVIRVWMYAPATPGFVVIDDVSLVAETFSTNPTSVGFGNQMVNTTSVPTAVILTNTGGTPQPVSAGMNGINFADFTQTNDCPAILAVGASCTFSVSFTPRATGARFATLVVNGLFQGRAWLT